YGSKVWHSNSKYRRTVWQCNHKFKGQEKCATPHLDEDTIKELFVKAANKLLEDKDEIIANFESMKDVLYDTGLLETKQTELQNEMEIVTELIQQCITENANVALDQGEYQRRYDGLVQRFDTTKEDLEKVSGQIKEKVTRRQTLAAFLNELKKQDELLTDFDPLLWHSLVDCVTVLDKENVQITFKNGITI
ncbi:MAG: zinc ribbon domain-containing protein, partial [Cyclobacteriaceae bacterium]